MYIAALVELTEPMITRAPCWLAAVSVVRLGSDGHQAQSCGLRTLAGGVSVGWTMSSRQEAVMRGALVVAYARRIRR
jgi:hypothetical protein